MLRIESDVPLAPKTTLGIGGPARRFACVTDAEQLQEALRSDDSVLILGGGSNIVIGDAGWDGLVVQIGMMGIDIKRGGDHAVVVAGAGENWDELVAQTIDEGLAGLECLSGIPGLVGATPMQNVGAYGQEVSDTIERVRVLDRRTGELVDFEPHACQFAYRTSVFKGRSRWVVVEVQFRLRRSGTSMPLRYPELARGLGLGEGGRAPLAVVREKVIALRRTKGMVIDPLDPECRSVGSFFMNPIVDKEALDMLEAKLDAAMTIPLWPIEGGRTKLSAAWLIERAGFKKGYTVGRVGISKKHALAIVNRGGATASEVLALATQIQDRVRDKLGIELVPEPVIV